jgi:hypothetical protein
VTLIAWDWRPESGGGRGGMERIYCTCRVYDMGLHSKKSIHISERRRLR